MKTTEVNKELIGKRCECIFTGLMVTGVIEDTEETDASSAQLTEQYFCIPLLAMNSLPQNAHLLVFFILSLILMLTDRKSTRLNSSHQD